MNMITVAHQKGGVGKTPLALNLDKTKEEITGLTDEILTILGLQ